MGELQCDSLIAEFVLHIASCRGGSPSTPPQRCWFQRTFAVFHPQSPPKPRPPLHLAPAAVVQVPYWQNLIVQGCRKRGKPVIVATNSEAKLLLFHTSFSV